MLLCTGLFSVAEFGLFFADDDQKKGIWLENNRNLEHYLLRSGVSDWFSVVWLIKLALTITIVVIFVIYTLKSVNLYYIS